MKIIKNSFGWNVEPDTKGEEEYLKDLFNRVEYEYYISTRKNKEPVESLIIENAEIHYNDELMADE